MKKLVDPQLFSSIYLLKVNKRNTRTSCEISSQVNNKEHISHPVSFVNFEQVKPVDFLLLCWFDGLNVSPVIHLQERRSVIG